MEDKLRKVALDAKKAEPNDWYAQRTLMHIALFDGNDRKHRDDGTVISVPTLI